MEVTSELLRYQIGNKVVEHSAYRIYICTEWGTERQCLLQISTSVEQNAGLDRAAYALKELKIKSDALEAEYATIKTDPNDFLNYDLGFPELVSSFVSKEQGGRRVNVLAFRNVGDVGKLVPLDNVTRKDRRRVDLRTSGWIEGKLLKLQTFVHSEGFAMRLSSGKDILIEPDNHYVIVFDWSLVKTATPGNLPEADQRKDIMVGARAVLMALGTDFKAGTIPDVDDSTRAYADFLFNLAKGGASSAEDAHHQFYKLVDSIWPREFHPFTTKPLL